MSVESKVFDQLNKVELSSQRIELAKKAPQILADAKKANDLLLKAEQKIETSFLAYKKAWGDFQIILKVVEDSANSSEKDLIGIMDSLQAIGMNPNEAQKIDGFGVAADLVTKIQGSIPNYKRLYAKPE